MMIDDMAVDSEVMLKVYGHQGEIVDFSTKLNIIYHSEDNKDLHCVGADPIRVDGKLVVFKGNAVEAYVINDFDKRTYVFNLYKIGLTKHKDRLLLFSRSNVKPKNFRLSYRVPCSYKTVFRAGVSGQIDAHIHDISFNGVSFVCSVEAARNINVADSVIALVYDKHGMQHRVNGHVVRLEYDYKNSGKVLVGVSIDVLFEDMVSMVVELQRDECRIRHNT